jgi:hypothetical protein
MKKLIVLIVLILYTVSVSAAFDTIPASRQTHSSDIDMGCVNGQYYRPGPRDCKDICQFNYEFKAGNCVSRCEGDKGFVWFDDRQLCEDICITQPQHDMCENGKWVGFDNCLWYKKMIGLCGEKPKQEDNNDQDNTKSENNFSKEECVGFGKWRFGKCKIRTKCNDDELWDGQKCEYRCEFDQIWFNLKCVNENDPYGLFQMDPNSHKIEVDEKGKSFGIIRHPNGAIVFTRDGQRYFQSMDEMDNRGVINTVFEGIVNGWDFTMGKVFTGGKSKDPDKKMQELVADELLKELKNMNPTKEWRNKVAQQGATEGISTTMGVLIGPAAKGISAPAETIKMLAERGAQIEFEDDIKEYINLRKIMGMNDVQNADTLQDVSTLELFKNNEKAMYETFEVAYQRYLLFHKMSK